MRGPLASNPHTRALLLTALATLGLFTAHHVYGALLYQTPWRHHAGIVAFGVAAALLGAAAVYRRRIGTLAGRIAGGSLAALTLAFPVLLVGLFEGLYNHLLKDLLFLTGAPRELLLRLFPPPTYELPNGVLFEVSGVLQVLAALLTARALFRFVRVLRFPPAQRTTMSSPNGEPTPCERARPQKLGPGAVLPLRRLEDLHGRTVQLPDAELRIHLQLRRFAGCPVCNLHLRSFARRHAELERAGIREVVVFHSAAEELRLHADGLPFAVIADPDKHLYAALGAESALRALLDPRAWWPILRAMLHGLVSLLRNGGSLPSLNPKGGRLGLPADFLIASDGRVLACKYGQHVDDQWSVDDLLALAGSPEARTHDVEARPA